MYNHTSCSPRTSQALYVDQQGESGVCHPERSTIRTQNVLVSGSKKKEQNALQNPPPALPLRPLHGSLGAYPK